MIQRYTHPDMGRIWSDQRKYETWLQVEIAAVEAMAQGRHRAAPRPRATSASKGAFDDGPASRKSRQSRSTT